MGAEVVGQKGDAWEEHSGKVGAGSRVRLAGGAQWEGGGREPGEAGRRRRGCGACFLSCDHAGRSTRQDRGRPAQWLEKCARFTF